MYWGVELLKTITDENKKEILFQKYNVDITGEKLQCMKIARHNLFFINRAIYLHMVIAI
jgi:hypothetical protein